MKHNFYRVKSINLPCLGYRQDCGCGDCEYENSGNCDECICCVDACGYYDTRTGKRVNWILRKIQDYRCRKYHGKENRN